MNIFEKKSIGNFLAGQFPPFCKAKSRIDVIPDEMMFNHKEDRSVWEQVKGIKPVYYSIYWDGEFMTGYYSNHPREALLVGFFTGFDRKYEKKDIGFTLEERDAITREYKESEEQAQKKKEDTIKKIIAVTPEEKAAKEIATDIIKKKDKKKIKI